MAGIFKTIGNSLAAVDTLAASGSRRIAVWAREQETQTKYRHVSAMTRIKTDSAQELAGELKRYNEAIKDPDIKSAFDVLNALDAAEQQADARG
jgi:hypothetical protein